MEELPERFRPLATWLQSFAARTPGVVAAYVGGSLVNDRIDDDSDLDVNIATTRAERDAVFEPCVTSCTRRETPGRSGSCRRPRRTEAGGVRLLAELA